MPERSSGAQGLKARLGKRGVIPRMGATFKLGFAETENHLASKRPLVRSAANWTFSWSNSGIVVSMVTRVPVIVPRMKAVVHHGRYCLY